MAFDKIFQFFVGVYEAYKASKTLQAITTVFQIVTLAVGVKGFLQARQMLAKGQDIMLNKTSAGGKIPVIYGTRRVGAQIVYMDVSGNDSRDLYVVYALSVGECDEILGRTIELDGNPLTDSARFRDGGYIGSDKISSGAGSLNTVSQNGTDSLDVGGGNFGTNPAAKYRYVMNLHHGAASQTADPMLVASMPNWTSSHRLDGICYIAAHYGYDKEGMWSGIPQLTVQVRGKKVYDPRDAGQTFGTVSTYEYSDNPALCFLDFITDNQFGKGLTESQINMSTFSSAANVCDTQVDQPYFNGTAQSLTWSANAGDDFFTISGTLANTQWYQNKIGELLDLFDGNGNGVLDEVEIKEIQRSEFFDSNEEFLIFINGTFSSTYSTQTGTSLLKVKRFTCNGYLDTNKNVMDNAKELLANMRGIFLYINGQYELSIEDTGSSTFSINDNHIISESGISVDYGKKDNKANKVIVEFFNANKKYELDTATVLHDATPEYYSDDDDEILEIKAEFPYITDPYIAYNMGKAILTRSRNQTTMQFLGTPEMYKLNVGDIVDLTYAGLGFSGKVCRVEALELQSDGLVAVSLIEYFDVYTWEVPPQEPVEELANLPSAYAVKAPTGLSFTDTDSSSTGRPFLSWDEPTDFPDYQYRVNVVDSSSNQVINRIVDVENCDLNFLPVDSNYVASVTSLNVLGTESSAATLTFTIGDAPTDTADIKNDAITTVKILDDNVTDAKIQSLTANKITAGTIDASVITVTNLDADNITSGTIGADKIDVTNLSSISADLGSITAGSMNIGSGAFTVSSAGVMTASGATISGSVTATSGTIGGVTLTSNKIHLGTGTFNNSNTPFYVDTSGQFSLKDKLSFDGADLVINGKVKAPTLSASGQAGLYSLIPTSITGGSDDAQPVISADTDTDLGTVILATGDPYDSSLWTSGSPDTDATGLWLGGSGTIYMLGTGQSFRNSPISSGINSLGTDANGWKALYLHNNTSFSSTSNALYQLNGSLYFNGSAVGGGGGSGDITSVTAGTNLNGGGTSGDVTVNLDTNLSGLGTISSGSITVDPSGTYGDGITINAGDNLSATNSAKQIIMSFGGTTSIDYAHSIRTRHNSGADTGNTLEVYLWDYGTDSSSTIGTKRALVLENSTGLDLLTGGYKVGGTTVIDSSRNLTNITSETITGTLNEALNFSATTTNDARGISFNARTALTADSSDGWLRLNNSSEFSNGVYTPANFRSDGNVRGATFNLGSLTIIREGSSFLRINQSNEYSNGIWTGISNIQNGSGVGIATGSNGTFSTARVNISGGTYNGSNVISLDGTDGKIKGQYFNVGGTTVIDSSRNLVNIGTISSGAITSSGNLHAGDGTNISMDASASGQLQVDGNGYNGAIALDGSAMHVYHNSSLRDLVLGTNETARLTIGGTGGFNFHSNNLTSVGTISSGAITSSGDIRANGGDYFTNSGASGNYRGYGDRLGMSIVNGATYIYDAASSAAISLAAFQGNVHVYNELKMGNLSGTTVIDSSRNATFVNLRADGGNLIMGDEAYSVSGAYVGMKTSFQSGSNDYMIISGTSDGNTYVSAKDGRDTHIRGGGNNSSNAIVVPDGTTITATTSDFRVSGNVTAYASDKRLKTNIQTIKNPIEKIKKIRGVEFDWIDNIENFNPKHKHETGVIAQEIEEVIPDAVDKAPFNEEYKTVDKEKIVALLIEAIKDQQQQIDELKARLDNGSSK